MGQNCEKFIGMCLESVIDADAIVYCSGGEYNKGKGLNDNAIPIVEKFYNQYIDLSEDGRIICNKYDQNDKLMNGCQRNFYLDYIKKNYHGWFCLALDADEVVEDLSKIKEWINKYDEIAKEYPCVSVKMRHFQQDLGHEDATVPEHFVTNRLFKIEDDLFYPEVEHPVLQSKTKQYKKFQCRDTTIWHLAYIPNLWDIKKRYDNHIKKSNMHSPEFLKWWYHNHLFGSYPKKEIKKTDIPKVILDEFGIDKDELYFTERTIDMKHPMMVQQWNDYFKPKSVLDLGCGRGCYLFFWKWFEDNIEGIELSEWAVNHAFVNGIKIGDISEESNYRYHDLITAVDVLEHLEDDKLDKTLKNMVKFGNRFLFSIPFIGDPNLTNDSTHKQFRTKEEWKILISSYGIEISDVPETWYFKNQLLIGKKKDINSMNNIPDYE